MNNVYFGCLDCKIYVDAGYRWAYWSLEETGIVNRKDVVSADAVFAAQEYWNPGQGEVSRHLTEALGSARTFLEIHRTHALIYGDDYRLYKEDMEGEYLDWMEVGEGADLSPRLLAEKGLRDWSQVLEFIRRAERKPWWWTLDDFHLLVREKFEALISKG